MNDRRAASVSDRCPSDQHPVPARSKSVDPEMVRVLAEKTEAERLRIGWGMWRSARRMIARIVSAEHPDWSEQEVAREVAKRLSHGS